MGAGDLPQFTIAASLGLLIAGASSMVGGLLGFLFGIPRSLQASDSSGIQPTKPSLDAGSTSDQIATYRANTNLEQISDWLTKILVGVGLTQLTILPEKLGRLALFLSPGFGRAPHSDVLIIAVILYFAISGFLFGYLWTRLFLGGALREADVAALGEKISELERQMAQDARASNLVQQHLNPRTDSPGVSEDAIREAIAAASPAAQTTIFYQAEEVRNRNWRDEKTKPRMERTQAIFRALCDSDRGRQYHEYHAQLAFVLKDKDNPDWTAAEGEFTMAIEIRGDWRMQGRLSYEFNRAICRIYLDESVANDKQEQPMNRANILADLRAAASRAKFRSLIEESDVVRRWMEKNQTTMDNLGSISEVGDE